MLLIGKISKAMRFVVWGEKHTPKSFAPLWGIICTKLYGLDASTLAIYLLYRDDTLKASYRNPKMRARLRILARILVLDLIQSQILNEDNNDLKGKALIHKGIRDTISRCDPLTIRLYQDLSAIANNFAPLYPDKPLFDPARSFDTSVHREGGFLDRLLHPENYMRDQYIDENAVMGVRMVNMDTGEEISFKELMYRINHSDEDDRETISGDPVEKLTDEELKKMFGIEDEDSPDNDK